jgi:RimJ/RimL family protein N-acetyltransferase
MRVVRTDDLTLEPLLALHAQEMFVVLSDPAIYEYENEPPASVEVLREIYAERESRQSPNGREQWLNWVIRLADSRLIGYVQATVTSDGRAAIAYELASAYWGRGLAQQAVRAMIGELEGHHRVRSLSAVLKRGNLRSFRLLDRLGFLLASPEEHVQCEVERDELLMRRKMDGE